ncbi:MAG: sugar transferase [Nocardioides sp.]|nr:sugar transferase [Nocardioides sp.]
MHLRHHHLLDERVLVTPDTFRVGLVRRTLDIAIAGTLLVVTLPLLAVAALLVRLSDGGPAFFRQVRVGEGSRPFHLLKLRSMRVSKDGPQVTAVGDDRITAVGRILRRTSMDELPQLWHVVRGQMTLVGPRPESVELAEAYPASCRFILDARPGLTGPAQLTYREGSAVPPDGWGVEQWYLTRLVPLRVDADLDYLTDPSVRRTFAYLWRTALFVLGRPEGHATEVVQARADLRTP